MTFAWSYLDTGGKLAGSSQDFEDRDAAEEWMGRSWQTLLEDGVDQVELFEGKRRLYRMGLRGSS